MVSKVNKIFRMLNVLSIVFLVLGGISGLVAFFCAIWSQLVENPAISTDFFQSICLLCVAYLLMVGACLIGGTVELILEEVSRNR
jgi:hypothetical protein